MPYILWWFGLCAAVVFYLFILPTLINIVRHWLDDKDYSAEQAKRFGRPINSDGTAFNGNWFPIMVSGAAILFIIWVCLK
jgi:hypothetical protein